MLCLLVVIIILILLVMYSNNKNTMVNYKIKKEQLEDVYNDMETGDLLLITDKKNDIQSIRIIYRDNINNEIGYIKLASSGNLEIDSISNLLKNHKKSKILLLQLKTDLNYDMLQKVRQTLLSLHSYKHELGINAVITHANNKRDFFTCSLHNAKLLHDIGALKFANPECFSDPSECLQQTYKNSGFIQTELYNTEYVIQLL